MTWRWQRVQCEVAVKRQNSAKAVFYVSINVFNTKKKPTHNRKIQSEWCLSQIHLCTCSIQVKIITSLGSHVVNAEKQVGYLAMNHPLRFPCLSPNFGESRAWQGSHWSTSALVPEHTRVGWMQAMPCFGRKTWGQEMAWARQPPPRPHLNFWAPSKSTTAVEEVVRAESPFSATLSYSWVWDWAPQHAKHKQK